MTPIIVHHGPDLHSLFLYLLQGTRTCPYWDLPTSQPSLGCCPSRLATVCKDHYFAPGTPVVGFLDTFVAGARVLPVTTEATGRITEGMATRFWPSTRFL